MPRIVTGIGSTSQMGRLLKELKCKKPLIVTDAMLVQHGLVKKCLDSIEIEGFQHILMDSVVPDPPSELMDQGYDLYKQGGCDSIVAFGGGSPMDVAKLIGAKVANPRKHVKDLAGIFQVNAFGLRPIPPLIAVPTTAGTGSETTIAAITTVKAESKKYMVADLGLVPRVAVLDPEILAKLPKHITAATGIDALTHAVESFLGGWVTTFTKEHSLKAIGKIFSCLVTSYKDGSNLEARESMLSASYEAGIAFTRANVGYVHAIAHQLGALFHTPHGDANAMMLPRLLAYYLDQEQSHPDPQCIERFCEMAKVAGLVESIDIGDINKKREIARLFATKVADMCVEMNIPTEVKQMKATDVKYIAVRALKEAHGEIHNALVAPVSWTFDLGYPVPVYMTLSDCEALIATVLPVGEQELWKSAQAA